MDESNNHGPSSHTEVEMQWDVRIPLRDGIRLNAMLYLPGGNQVPSPVIFTLTPYIAQTYHAQAMYFAAHGYPFLTVDVRGRGNSEGEFKPNINEASDGHDVVEWLARQPYCDGRVAMWGGSYAGYDQWATAREAPQHLTTIVPAAAPCFGVDFPSRNNISSPYLIQWLTLVWGRTSQDKLFWNNEHFWRSRFRQWFESGAAFRDIGQFFGIRSAVFLEWQAHPHQDEYWDSYNPSERQYAQIHLPVLTITGAYDANQIGALTHYRRHVSACPPAIREQHHLVIGPWDHAGTRVPCQEFGGLKFGSASLVDLQALHREWYDWTMRGGQKPAFLHKNVAYYVAGAEQWRYADTLDSVTSRHQVLYLRSTVNPVDVFHSGVLGVEQSVDSSPGHYVYDPRDVSLAQLECEVDPASRVDQTMLHAQAGRQLVYHSAPLEADTEISGFFRLSLWLAIDQPDTDFRVVVYEVSRDGRSIQLTSDCLRARYRESLRYGKLVGTHAPLRYDFERFMFVSRRIRKGHRLRLVVGPVNSIYSQKNYNSGGVVSEESMSDARAVTVKLFHDESHPSALHVPIGQPYV